MGKLKQQVYSHEECIKKANDLLRMKAPMVPKVKNVGRAALVLLLAQQKMNLDYRRFEQRWKVIKRGGTSSSADDWFTAKIVATETHAIVLEPDSPEPIGPDDVVAAIIEITQMPRLVLGAQDERPRIDGIEAEPLSIPQYNVIKALVRATPDGLTKSKLRAESKQLNAVEILNLLAKKPMWDRIIVFPGGAWRGGYRLKMTDPSPF